MPCQCCSRYTHPFMAEYLTLSCRMSGEGCKKSSNACHGTDQNAPECTGKQKHSHICDKMTARCITQVGLQENTTEPEDTHPQTEILVTMCAILKQFLDNFSCVTRFTIKKCIFKKV